MSRLNLQPGARLTIGNATFEITRVAQDRTGQTCRRHLVRPAAADQPGRAARNATCAARQPGSLALSRATCAQSDDSDRAIDNLTAASTRKISIGRMGNPQPHQCLAAARTFDPAVHAVSDAGGLAALLVGGVGIANSAKYFLDRKREVIATMKSLGATGTRVFSIYLTAGPAVVVDRRRDRISYRRGAAVHSGSRSWVRSFRCRSSRNCIRASSRLRWPTAF